MKRLLHRCGCCDVLYDPTRTYNCTACGCYDYEEVYEDDVD